MICIQGIDSFVDKFFFHKVLNNSKNNPIIVANMC